MCVSVWLAICEAIKRQIYCMIPHNCSYNPMYIVLPRFPNICITDIYLFICPFICMTTIMFPNWIFPFSYLFQTTFFVSSWCAVVIRKFSAIFHSIYNLMSHTGMIKISYYLGNFSSLRFSYSWENDFQ